MLYNLNFICIVYFRFIYLEIVLESCEEAI